MTRSCLSVFGALSLLSTTACGEEQVGAFADGDDDCDGLVDERRDDFTDEATTWYIDADQDGHGASARSVEAYAAPEGYVASSGDCNDDDPAVHPEAQEVCSGVDDDCDGLIDDADESVAFTAPHVGYRDLDGDGFGGELIAVCDSALVVDVGGDCDDDDPGRYPGAPERCNGLDDDCDGLDDTLGYWPFDEGEGSTVASEGGLELLGELHNTEWTDDGASGGALVFDGLRSYVAVRDVERALVPRSGITVSAWVRPSSEGERVWRCPVSLGTTSGWANTYALCLVGLTPAWYLSDVDWHRDEDPLVTALMAEEDAPLERGGWYHLVAAWDDDGGRFIYVDGSLAAADEGGPLALLDFGGDLAFGADINGEARHNFFEGTLDEVKLLSCAVDGAEARADYQRGWPFWP